MIEIKLGDRYAKSILALAKEKGVVEEVRNDFALIAQVCGENPDLVKMLRSPLIMTDKKQQVLDKVFGKSLSKFTLTFLEIVLRKKREPWLNDIAQRFQHLYDLDTNQTRGTLTSAAPLSPALVAQICSIVERDLGTRFFLEERIDPNLIGGFVLRIGDKLFDGSLSTRLEKLRQEFEKNPYVKFA